MTFCIQMDTLVPVMIPVFDIRVYRNRRGISPFKKWISGVRDGKSRDVINQRITRLALGNFGDCRDLKGGVWELKISFGPGFRIYYGRIGATVVLLLFGGDKGSQAQDIEKAKEYLNDYKKRQNEDRSLD